MAPATTKKTENTFTVFRRQVIQTGDYEPAEASCSVTIAVDSEMSQEDIGEQIAEWGNTLEMANYEALGIGYEITEQGVRRLQKSVSGTTKSPPVAAAPARNSSSSSSGGTIDSLWRDLMDNKTDWWDPNWQKKLDPAANFNINGPDYKRKSDGKGLWLSKKDGSVLIPNWFVCPFTGKDSNELTTISATIRG
jgi:hypothetical protein